MKDEAFNSEELPLPPHQPNPVFVVGMNGSGTSMLIDSLGLHPEFFGCPKETHIFAYLISQADKFGDLNEDSHFLELWNSVRTIPILVSFNGGQPVLIPSNWQDYPRSLAAVIDAVFRVIAMKHGKMRWGEKTPQNIQHLNALLTLFPQAKFIHIYRDGRDCAASFQRRYFRTPELTVYRWKKVVSEGRQQGARLGQAYMEVKYEDLTADADYWMKEICRFLDLPFHPDVLLSRNPHKDPKKADKSEIDGKIKPQQQRWPTHFSAAKIEKLEKIGGDFLQQLGYDLQSGGGDNDPHPLLLKYWGIKDSVTQFSHIVWKKISGRSKSRWYRIIWRSVQALRNAQINKY